MTMRIEKKDFGALIWDVRDFLTKLSKILTPPPPLAVVVLNDQPLFYFPLKFISLNFYFEINYYLDNIFFRTLLRK